MSAEAKAKSGRWKEAESLYKGLLAQDQGDREIAAALIDLYEDQDEMDDALAMLEDLAHRDPENSAIQERIVLDLGARRKVRRGGESAPVTSSPSGPRIAPASGCSRWSCSSARARPEGEKILRALVDADPDDAGTRRALASELVRERRFPRRGRCTRR
jgi:thioredoxin-like negative regulator of GroEL